MTKYEVISMEERHKIEIMLSKYDITKQEVATESGKSYRTVLRFFDGTQHTIEVFKASKKLITQRISLLTQKSSDATNDLMELAHAS